MCDDGTPQNFFTSYGTFTTSKNPNVTDVSKSTADI